MRSAPKNYVLRFCKPELHKRAWLGVGAPAHCEIH
jgi:hypothetical protein